MTWYFSALLVLGAFLFMEFVAWFTHKYVMHGFLWILHEDHHIRRGKRFEKNDLFAVIFAFPSILLILLGSMGESGLDYRFWLGIGIALYGLAYVLFHDIYYHQRIKINRVSNKYLRAITKAHDEHHTFRADKRMVNFGFLWPPAAYVKKEFSQSN